MKRHSKCHDCPYRSKDRRKICAMCHLEVDPDEAAAIRKRFKRIKAKSRADE